jgi:hypothetical protein
VPEVESESMHVFHNFSDANTTAIQKEKSIKGTPSILRTDVLSSQDRPAQRSGDQLDQLTVEIILGIHSMLLWDGLNS